MIDLIAMALSGFEIAIGGITSIPVTGGLIFLGYKAFGEKNLDASKLKPKKPAPAKAESTKVTPDSKKVVEPKKDTDSKNSVAKEKLATIENTTPEKKIIESKKALDVKDSVKHKDNIKDVTSQVQDSKP